MSSIVKLLLTLVVTEGWLVPLCARASNYQKNCPAHFLTPMSLQATEVGLVLGVREGLGKMNGC